MKDDAKIDANEESVAINIGYSPAEISKSDYQSMLEYAEKSNLELWSGGKYAAYHSVATNPDSRYVEVIDKHGRTADGGLVLDKECLEALRKVMAWRGRHGRREPSLVEIYAEKFGEVIYNKLGLEFEVYT
jgi:hypothetical protein